MEPEDDRKLRIDLLVIVPMAIGVFMVTAVAAFGLMYLLDAVF